MALKRKSSDKGCASYDLSRFVSASAAERYEKTVNVVVRNCIPERGMDFGDYGLPVIVGYIEKCGWEKFVKEPLAAVDNVVREFYANAFEQKNGKTMVGGRTVKFEPSTINTFYGILEVDDGAYRAWEGEADYERVISTLTKLGSSTKWRKHKDEYRLFPSKYLTDGFRVWHYFVLARLMPSTHVSDVSKEREILLYAILKTMWLNVGSIIYASILHCTKIANAGFSFPSLITALCTRAGVRYESGEKLIQLKPVLNPHFYLTLTSGKWDVEPRKDQAPASLPSTSTSTRLTMEDRMGRVKEAVSAIRQTLDDQWRYMRQQHEWFRQQGAYQSAYLECIGKMSHMQVPSLGVDMTQFLPFPTYPGSKFANSSGAPTDENCGVGEEMNE